MSKNYFYAISVLIGTIVGAGIFSLPFVVNKSGLIPFYILLIVLTGVQYHLHKVYAEIVLSTKKEYQVPGYAGIYAGKKWKKTVSIFFLLGSYGSILAYIILGGIFLHGLFFPYFGGTEFIYSLIMFSVGALIVFLGIKTIASVEFLMTIFLILIVGIITSKSFVFIDLNNYLTLDWKYAMLPYGMVFFSVGGQTAIPILCRLLNKESKSIKSVIFLGTIIPAVITAIFVTAVVGVTGAQTSPDTLVGLMKVFSGGAIILILLFGFLSIMTSFLTITQAVKESFFFDFKMGDKISWALACLVPFLFFVFGMQNFTTVVGVTGSITGGIIGIIVIFLALLVKKNPQQKSIIQANVNLPIAIFLTLLFIAGTIFGLVELF